MDYTYIQYKILYLYYNIYIHIHLLGMYCM
jgi:hypothetical protein